MTTETASEDDNFGTAQSNKVKLFLPVVPLFFSNSPILNQPAGKTNWIIMYSVLFIDFRGRQYNSVLFLCRPSLMLWEWRGGTGCWQGCTWAARTRSWWCARPPYTSGKSLSQTLLARCGKSCQHSLGFCWNSWPVLVQISERWGIKLSFLMLQVAVENSSWGTQDNSSVQAVINLTLRSMSMSEFCLLKAPVIVMTVKLFLDGYL